MADDCVGLLDELGVEAAHLVGASQGGMIAQTVAIRHPDRVLSLVSIMSTTGDRSVGQPHPEAIPALLTRPPAGKEGFVDFVSRGVEGDRLTRVRRRMRMRSARGRRRATTGGSTRMGRRASCWRSAHRGIGPRRCGELDLPTTVIHGTDDILIDVSGGKATAAAIPGSAAGADRGDGARHARAVVAAIRGADHGDRRAGEGTHRRLTPGVPPTKYPGARLRWARFPCAVTV